ncbi:N-acetyltransferase family protein [Martelella alba]|uniref:N-acetyltransferase family protein n=1 Tax=Martelella alba TaxID=2590451 RepID=A0A506U6I4_9HYPH|nr:GNAT family N-acetyltransferase [Martelella alba]TPW27517.1 N-acetyltransferase family protein [Martelella alba]
MTITIRPAGHDDLPAITAIYAESVLNGTASYELDPPDETEMHARMDAILEKRYPYFAATDEDGTLIGYAYASAFRTRPAYRWIVEDSIYIAKDQRGRGIGKALLSSLIEASQALGFRQMIAVIGGAAPASVALHRGLGFADAGRLEGTGFKHGGWLDTVFMQKSLGDGTTTLADTGRYPGVM